MIGAKTLNIVLLILSVFATTTHAQTVVKISGQYCFAYRGIPGTYDQIKTNDHQAYLVDSENDGVSQNIDYARYKDGGIGRCYSVQAEGFITVETGRFPNPTVPFQVFNLTSIDFISKKLILIGGGQRPESALINFARASAGKKILVIPWASAEPLLACKSVMADLLVYIAPEDLECATTSEFAHVPQQYSGVFFTGGDQTKIMAVLNDSEVSAKLKAMYEKGVVFAGTSAGTAIMSSIMLVGDETAVGFGLLEDIILDQHFLTRNREARLLKALKEHPEKTGVGIDENTAVILDDGTNAKVVGTSTVSRYRMLNATEHELTIYKAGQAFNL